MKTEQDLPFSDQLRRYRTAHGLTQEELAERAGLSPRGIRALERGERTAPRRDTVQLLADALQLSEEDRQRFERAARIAGPLPEAERSPAPAPLLPSEPLPAGIPTGGRRPTINRRRLPAVTLTSLLLLVLAAALGFEKLPLRGQEKSRVIGAPVVGWGLRAQPIRPLAEPVAVAVNGGGEIYVLDRGDGLIHKFAADGEPLLTWGGKGSARGHLLSPSGLALDRFGNIYVADTGNNRLQVFSASGRWQATWLGSGTTRLSSPSGVAVGPNDHVYVSDFDNDRVDVFSITGRPIGTWTGRRFYYPGNLATDRQDNVYVLLGPTVVVLSHGVVVNRWAAADFTVASLAVDPHGDIWEAGGAAIHHFTPGGRLLRTIPVSGARTLEGIAVDRRGYLYLADGGSHEVEKVSPSGTVVARMGKPSSSPERFDAPGAVAVDRGGHVYAALSGGRIKKYSPAGELLDAWTVPGASSAIAPRGIAVDMRGNIAMVDGAANRLWRLTGDGRVVGQWGGAGAGPGRFDIPAAVTVDERGDMYVADAGNARIQEFSPMGRVIRIWDLGPYATSDVQSPYPFGVAVDARNMVYVADAFLDTIMKLSPAGRLITTWGRAGTAPAQFRSPGAIALGRDGELYVVDAGNSRIQVLSSSGHMIQVVGRPGSGIGAFKRPTGIAVDTWGNTYVADTGNHRIQKFLPG